MFFQFLNLYIQAAFVFLKEQEDSFFANPKAPKSSSTVVGNIQCLVHNQSLFSFPLDSLKIF